MRDKCSEINTVGWKQNWSKLEEMGTLCSTVWWFLYITWVYGHTQVTLSGVVAWAQGRPSENPFHPSCVKRKWLLDASSSSIDHIFLWMKFHSSVTQRAICFRLYWIVGFLKLQKFRHQQLLKEIIWTGLGRESISNIPGKEEERERNKKEINDSYTASVQQRLVLVTQSCLTLCAPMDCSPPGSSVHGFSRLKY